MSNQKYQREAKEDRPVVAICYDFDKTAGPGIYPGCGL